MPGSCPHSTLDLPALRTGRDLLSAGPVRAVRPRRYLIYPGRRRQQLTESSNCLRAAPAGGATLSPRGESYTVDKTHHLGRYRRTNEAWDAQEGRELAAQDR